ncbi:MAG: hypothetical protein HY674_16285 [Chloroflexi bacterium]|nr:hypothetical protein [Chloroflexota bacterium]
MALSVPGGLTEFDRQALKNSDNPNIVCILVDDLGYGDVKCLNPQLRISPRPPWELSTFASTLLTLSVVLLQPGFRKCGSSRLTRGVAITLDGVLGFHYRVEYRNSLNPADPWQLLQDIPVLNSTPLLVNDPTPIQTQRFYRAVQLQ